MISHCTRALYMQISWTPPFDAVTSVLLIFTAFKKKRTFQCLWADDLQEWARKKRNFCFVLFSHVKLTVWMDLKWLNDCFKVTPIKLKSKFGSWTKEFWPAWLENKNNDNNNPVVYAVVFPSYFLAFICNGLPEVFYVGGWASEKVKCLVGILCHCQCY